MRNFFLLLGVLLSAGIAQAQNFQKLPCATDLVWQEQIKNNPESLKAYQDFEADFAKFKLTYNADNYRVNKGLNKKAPKYIIPVVVHIFHANGSENLTDGQVNNVIAGMNQYAAGTVSGISQVRPIFQNLIADCEIEFRLARKDPQGNCTNGITRTYTPQTARGNDLIKDEIVWDTKRYLNIWICKEVYSGATAVGGYANLPFGGGLTSKNGVILVASQFIGDNVGIHEVGHWLGLLHPFQDSDSCSTSNDGVDDTPPTFFRLSTTGTNTGRGNHCGDTAYNSCNTATPPNTPDLPDMQENIMDYFGGPCSGLMFTLQQKARMIYCLETFRSQLIAPSNLIATGTDVASTPDCAPIAAFNTRTQTVCAGGTASFIDFSYNASSITSYTWEFEGGNPATSNLKTPPAVTYANPGKYGVKLTATNAKGTNTLYLPNYVTVNPATADITPGWMVTADWWYMNNWEAMGWKFDNGFAINSFKRASSSYKNNAGMMLPMDPYNAKNSMGNSFSLISPAFNFSNVSRPYFAFNYAFARGLGFTDGSGNKLPTTETLTLHSSIDCGKTWVLRSNVASTDISTIGASVTLPNSTDFYPSDATKWKEVSYTAASFPKTPSVMFKITFNYMGGNNFFLDNVRLGDGAPSGINNLENEMKFAVYPNPFSGTTTLSYELKGKETVDIDLYDITGKLIGTLYSGEQNAGSQSIVLDRNQFHLEAGIYLIQLKAGNESLNHKIIIE